MVNAPGFIISRQKLHFLIKAARDELILINSKYVWMLIMAQKQPGNATLLLAFFEKVTR